jgi:quinol monooxygenase YgiN
MYVITVQFVVVSEKVKSFRAAMVENARASREREPGCQQFDVCVDTSDPTLICLYEVYEDRAAFDAHVASAHFRAFDETTRGWVTRKTVNAYERIDP